MVGVEESVELLAPPKDANEKTCVERREQALQEPEREPIRLGSLDTCHGRSGATGANGQVGLRPAPPAAQGSDGKAQADSIHVRRIGTWTYAPITRGCVALG